MSPLQQYKCVDSQVECCHTCFLDIWEVGKCSEVDLDGEQSHSQTERQKGRCAIEILHLQKHLCVLLQMLPDVHFDKQLVFGLQRERCWTWCWTGAGTWWLSGGGCCAEDQAGKGCEMMDHSQLEGTDRPGKQVKTQLQFTFHHCTDVLSMRFMVCFHSIPLRLIHSCYASIFIRAITLHYCTLKRVRL